jgi:hypothetical protein
MVNYALTDEHRLTCLAIRERKIEVYVVEVAMTPCPAALAGQEKNGRIYED